MNEQQRAAARFGAGPLLIIAGAGTGKTNTLTHRVAHLVLEGGAPERILLLTFTRRAALEMTRRASRIVAEAHRSVRLSWSGTFHSVAKRLTRRHCVAVGLHESFSVLDRGDAADLMDVVRHELGFDLIETRDSGPPHLQPPAASRDYSPWDPMPVTWSMLHKPEPTALAAARALAHRAAQWPTRAARANLAPAPDDSHSSLAWDPDMAALLTQPLDGGVRVGLHVAVLELVFAKGERSGIFPLAGKHDSEVGNWLDGKLIAEGLKPASATKLAYELPPTLFARPAEEGPRLAALGVWFAAGAEMLEELRQKHRRFKPGPTPVRCWPHHFDIAMVVELDDPKKTSARSIGIGLSPGDNYYAQPYFYLSPTPTPHTDKLPPLPPGGRWHTKDFFGAVATATDVLLLPDPRKGLLNIVDAAFEESLKWLKV